MLKKPWEGYLRTDEIIEEITGNFTLSEIDKNNQWSMHLNINTNPSSTFYRLFYKDQVKERSRITFGKLENFPDAIILERLANDTLNFHIFELKKRPNNGDNIEKISKQFLGGYLHTKLIRTFLSGKYLSSITYKYYVVFTDDQPKQLGFRKVIPGERVSKKQTPEETQRKIKRDRVLREWKRNRVTFRSLDSNSYYVFNNVSKIVLKPASNKPDIISSYEETLHI